MVMGVVRDALPYETANTAVINLSFSNLIDIFRDAGRYNANSKTSNCKERDDI